MKVDELKPVKIEEATPIKIEEPKPVEVANPKPVEIERPKPAETEKKKLVNIDAPKPVKVAELPPVKVEETKLAPTGKPNPAEADVTAETGERPVEAVKSDVFRALPSTYKIPGLAGFSIASVRKFAGDDGRKIKFGDRKKTVSIREQDFRYAMYVESVRLKLQRIGTLNYPAAAARDNLSGTLSVTISIRADGSLDEFRVTQPSVYGVLNEGAERIVKMCSPFSPLPDNIRQDTDLLIININWTFSKSGQSFE